MPAVTAEKPMIKSSKPLMEKRRRARINDSLMQLKSLVLDALNKNNPRHSKLEKADILEMTVRYLRMVRRQQISASVNMDPSKLGQYRSGYAECINEVTRYLGATSSTDGSSELRSQLVGHLANPSSQQQQQTSPSSPLPQHQQTSSFRGHQQQHQLSEPSVVYVDAKSRIAPSIDSNMISPANHNGLVQSQYTEGAQSDYYNAPQAHNTHEIDHRRVVMSPSSDTAIKSLPSGEIAVVLPQQTLSNGQLPTHFIPVYAQGPVVVSPTTDAKYQAPSPSDSYRSHSPSLISASNSPVVSPVVGTCASPLTLTSSQVYQQLSPIAFEQYSAYEMAAPISDRCVSKKETMWRPW